MLRKAAFYTLALLAVTSIITGCGSSGTTGNNSMETGSFRLNIQWGESGQKARTIPGGSVSIKVSIEGTGLETPAVSTINQGDPGVILIEDIPAGAKTATIQAFDEADGAGNITAQRKEGFQIAGGQTHDSGNIPLGVALKMDETDLVFEPSLIIDIPQDTNLYFQNWTDRPLTVAADDKADIVLPAASSDITGAPVYSGQSVQISEYNSFYEKENPSAKFTADIDLGWTTEYVDASSSDLGKTTGIVFDSSGNPHLEYFDQVRGDIRYAAKNGGSWMIETVNNGSHYSGLQGGSIGIAPSGDIYVPFRYYEYSVDAEFRVRKKSGASWPLIYNTGPHSAGEYPAIAFKPDGLPVYIQSVYVGSVIYFRQELIISIV